MATLNRTFSVKNGIDVANTIIVDSNRNLTNIATANANTVNATTFITVDGLNVTDQANSARLQANTARDTANDAYGQANAAYGQANVAYGQANAAYLQANNAYAEANLKLNLTGGTITGNLNVNNYIYANAFISTSENVVPPNLANTDGERLRLFDFEQPGHPNYAIGVEPNYIWAGTDENNGGTGFKWYGNTTQVAVMRSNGTLQLSNTVEAKVIKANGTGTAIDASQGNILTNQVTGTQFNFLSGIYTATITGSGSVASNYTLNLPANTGLAGQTLITDGSGGLSWSSASLDQANGAYAQANGAYAQANGAYAQANGAYAQANGAYASANGAYAQANGAYAQANGAYTQANLSANTVQVSANGGSTLSNKSLNFANSLSIQVTVTDAGDGNANVVFNTTGAAVADAYDQANAAYGQANSARGQANTARDTANDAYAQANTARGTANDAYGQANAAYAEANLKLNLTGGTITGDLDITGNLYVGGNTTYINVSTYTVEDPLIYLAANNELDDMVDIGFVGGKNAAGVYAHTGLVRHAADDKWYLFDGLAEEGHQNNVIDVANTYLATLRANIEANSILLVGNSVATQANLTIANDQANAARDQANTAYGQANDAYGQANTARTTANDAYGQANTARDTANDSYAQANTARTQANTARTQANTAYGQANDAYAQANTAYGQANDAYAQANAAFGDSNNRVLKSGDTMTGTLTITTSGTGLSVGNVVVSSELSVGSLNVTTNTVTTSMVGQVVLDTFGTTEHASAKYFVQVKSGSAYHTTEVVLVQDATNVWLTEYGSIQTGATLGTFSADINSGEVRLLFNADNAVNTIRAVRYGVAPP